MTWSQEAFTERLNLTDLMVNAIRANLDGLTPKVTEADAEALEAGVTKLREINQEQERLKASLKQTTADLENEDDTVGKTYMTIKKILKLIVPKELWKEYGIIDER